MKNLLGIILFEIILRKRWGFLWIFLGNIVWFFVMYGLKRILIILIFIKLGNIYNLGGI